MKTPLMSRIVAVAHPDNVEYMLRTKFWDFEKGFVTVVVRSAWRLADTIFGACQVPLP